MAPAQPEYARLAHDEHYQDEKEISDSDEYTSEGSGEGCKWCRGEQRPPKKQWTCVRILVTVLGVIIVFMLGAATDMFWNAHRRLPTAMTYETEYAPARKAVELEQHRFTGSALFDDQGEPYFNYPPGQVLYSGAPSEEIDKAWWELVKRRYFLISDEEALAAWGPSYKQYYRYPGQEGHEGGYVAGLDVMHTLHCVNMLRMAIYKDHYKDEMQGSEKFKQYHVDHCLDIVRQNIQCNSDLTLIPTRWWEGLGPNGRNFIDSDQVHTCRNFNKIRDWGLKHWAFHHRYGNVHAPPVDSIHYGTENETASSSQYQNQGHEAEHDNHRTRRVGHGMEHHEDPHHE